MLFPSGVREYLVPMGADSMSTSLLYHALGLRGYDYVKTDYRGGAVTFTIRQRRHTYRCSACDSLGVHPRGHQERIFRAVPIGHKPVRLVLAIPRVYCPRCGVIRQAAVPFAEPRRTYTRGFERYALELGRLMTIQDVARHLGVSWDVVKDIQKRDLQRRFRKPRLSKLKRIAIDEIAVAKGHRYLTVVLNLDTGAVVFVGDGKGADALDPFWRRLRASKAKVEAVATDLSAAYIGAVTRRLPEATLVFDRFHVMKLVNDKLTALRRQLHARASGEDKRVLKGARWLLLKRPENLEPRRRERERLQEALRLNEPLATAYYLKEDLGQFWEQEDDAQAQAFLLDWLGRAEASGIPLIVGLARTLRGHALGLLAYYDYPISTGPLEGTNNKIKTMKRQAYGYRDKEFFKLKILAAHEAKYALVG
jgi:transposase